MNPAEHYEVAERLLDEAERNRQGGAFEACARYLQCAQVHATLASVADSGTIEQALAQAGRPWRWEQATTEPPEGEAGEPGPLHRPRW